MRTNLKVVLATLGIAVLASPVMAQSLIPRPDVELSAANISNARGSAIASNAHGSVSNARGSAAHTRASRAGAAAPIEGSEIRLDDCVHVAFPQCGGDATQSQVDRP
jgi:hypothetical protein